jgi:hypothetical protein
MVLANRWSKAVAVPAVGAADSGAVAGAVAGAVTGGTGAAAAAAVSVFGYRH